MQYVVTNKTISKVNVAREFRVIPTSAAPPPHLSGGPPVTLVPNGKTTFGALSAPNVGEFEEVLVLQQENSNENLVYPLSNAKRCHNPSLVSSSPVQLLAYPIPVSPFVYIAFEDTLHLQLFQSALHGSKDAVVVLSETPDGAKAYAEAMEFVEQYRAPATVHLSEALQTDASKFLSSDPEHLKQVLLQKPVKSIPFRFRDPQNPTLAPEEVTARDARSAQIKKKPGKNPPVISCATSGGGMRAMIGSTGFYAAAKEIGLLDQVTYVAALSGSTWSTSKWMLTKEKSGNPLVKYKTVPANKDGWNFDIPPQPYTDIDYTQLISIGEFGYSDNLMRAAAVIIMFLNHSVLAGYSFMLFEKLALASIGGDYTPWVDKSKSGKFPIPACTASFLTNQNKFEFLDFTPFEIGGTYLSTYFNVKDFLLQGGMFEPPWLHELAGIWGSAFAAPLVMILEAMGFPLPWWLRWILGNWSPISGGVVYNVNFKQENPKTKLPLPMANDMSINYRDGGIASNIPIPPMLRQERKVDIVVVFDSSVDLAHTKFGQFTELVKAVPEIEKYLPKTPTFPYVFQATDKFPTIIYIPGALPLAKFDPNFDPAIECGTFKFVYPADLTTKLAGLGHMWTLEARSLIEQAISNYYNN